MTIIYARDFSEIPEAIRNNDVLLARVLELIESEKIAGKVTEGRERLISFKEILVEYFSEHLELQKAVRYTEDKLDRSSSRHCDNNKVFAQGWAERLVRTQVSRFYNQAVLEIITENGEEECFIEHSIQEKSDSKCSLHLANTTQNASIMLDRLKSAYGEGNWSSDPKLPEHPHCSHTFVPLNN